MSSWRRRTDGARHPAASSACTAVCTTDDPADRSHYHEAIAASGLATQRLPDVPPRQRAGRRTSPRSSTRGSTSWRRRRTSTSRDFDDLLDALAQRHQAFHDAGCRLSDHGLDQLLREPLHRRRGRRRSSTRRARARRARRRSARRSPSYLMLFFGRLDAEKGWTKQLHLGARRNNNTRGCSSSGRDTGFDSIGDWPQVDALGTYLDRLDAGERAAEDDPLQPEPGATTTPFATMIGNFQDGAIAGQDPVRQRLVVPRSEGRHGVADERALELGLLVALRRHAHRLALVHVVSAARILPPRALQSARPRRSRAASCRTTRE